MNRMNKRTGYQTHELLTREGREIFRLMRVHRDGISGDLECIYSESPIYEVGEKETNILERYDRVTPCGYPKLAMAIRENNLHLQLLPEALTEVIRQAYEIGVRDGSALGKQKPSDVLHRCSYIYRDIDMQLFNGPLSLHKYNLEIEPECIEPEFLSKMIQDQFASSMGVASHLLGQDDDSSKHRFSIPVKGWDEKKKRVFGNKCVHA